MKIKTISNLRVKLNEKRNISQRLHTLESINNCRVKLSVKTSIEGEGIVSPSLSFDMTAQHWNCLAQIELIWLNCSVTFNVINIFEVNLHFISNYIAFYPFLRFLRSKTSIFIWIWTGIVIEQIRNLICSWTARMYIRLSFFLKSQGTHIIKTMPIYPFFQW